MTEEPQRPLPQYPVMRGPIPHQQAKPLLKLFSKMLRRGKYRSQTQRPRKKKVRIV